MMYPRQVLGRGVLPVDGGSRVAPGLIDQACSLLIVLFPPERIAVVRF